MAESIDRRIAELSKRGYVRRVRLLAAGIGAEAIRYRVHVGRLIPEYAGVYAVGHVPTLPQDRAYGAVLACGPGAALSHGSAASLWGILKSWDFPFEVTVMSRRRPRGIHTHRAKLTPDDTRIQAGIRVTSPARTVLDTAPRLTDDALTRAVNDLGITHHLRREHLAEVVDRFPRHPGASRLRPFVEKRRGWTRSDLEDRFVPFCERFGLPTPLINECVAGREVDAFFPVERLIVELDGYDFHSSKASFRSDRDNDAHALALDIPTVRITSDRVDHEPEKEARRLARILELRRRSP